MAEFCRHFSHDELIMKILFCLFDFVDRSESVEFYDFLQVNTNSNKSEVTDNARRDDEEVNQDAMEQQNNNGVPFIDFLSTGNC